MTGVHVIEVHPDRAKGNGRAQTLYTGPEVLIASSVPAVGIRGSGAAATYRNSPSTGSSVISGSSSPATEGIRQA